MAYAHTGFGFQQTHADPTIDSKPTNYFPQHDSGVLEPALLTSEMMHNPDVAPMHKPTYMNNNGILSPTTPHTWNGHFGGGLPIDTGPGPHHFHTEHHVFGQEPAHQGPPFAHVPQHTDWSFDHAVGVRTPTTTMDFEPTPSSAQFDTGRYAHQRTDSARGSFSQLPRQPTFGNTEESYIAAPQVQTPMSPHCHQDWVRLNAMEVEARPHAKRMRAASPPRTSIDFQRGDGIRKRNARIDIPQERNIQMIEELLEKETDEDTLKELKQQKRLLRNREAALASRQRKKKHTEDLEVREKDFTRTYEQLQTQITTLKLEREAQDQNLHELGRRCQEMQRHIDTVEDEKRNMTLKHQEEVSTLRRRLHAMTEHLEHDLAPAMSTVPSSTGFADFNAEMEALNMSSHDWDSLIFASDLHDDTLDDISFGADLTTTTQSAQPERSHEASPAVAPVSKSTPGFPADQPVTSGLLFFLLLCGAFVASRPSTSHSADLPNVPAAIRAAAPRVLNNLLYDSQSSTTNPPQTHTDASEPMTSAAAVRHTRPSNKLDRVHHRLTAPTRQQETDAIFSMTTSEFASISNTEYPFANEPDKDEPASAGQKRRTLGAILSDMEEGSAHSSSKAEVYTRSLLWDQIPGEVVRQFRDLVREANELDARERQKQRQQRA